MKVVDEEGKLLRRGERGEVLVRSSVRFPGYINEDGNSSNVQASGWFKIGDSGKITQDGNMVVK